MGKDIEKKAIVVFAEKCVGCVSCQLRCSLHKLKRFCPDRASVQVKRIAGKGKEQFSITFLEDCRQCGICARYCLYGALVYEKREEGA